MYLFIIYLILIGKENTVNEVSNSEVAEVKVDTIIAKSKNKNKNLINRFLAKS